MKMAGETEVRGENLPTYLPTAKIREPPAHAGSTLADFSILKMEAIRSSESSVHTRSTGRHMPEDGIFQKSNCSIFLEFF
jgi:hypothetical protein